MKNYHSFYLKILIFLEVKFSIYLNRRVSVMVVLNVFSRVLASDAKKELYFVIVEFP